MKIKPTDISDPVLLREVLGITVYDDDTVRSVVNSEPVSISAAAYTLSADDVGAYLRTAGVTTVSIILPDDSTAPIPVGSTIVVEQANVGKVTVTSSSGVTLNSRAGYYSTAGQYAVVQIKKVEANVWTLIGDVGE